MSIQSSTQNSRQVSANATQPMATIVSEANREDFLPELFGKAHFFVAENVVYNFMGWLSPQDYAGGFWDFFELSGTPLYLVPPAKDHYRIACETNGYEGEVSADAAGIIVTLFAFSHLSFKFQSDVLGEGYRRLFDYAAQHSEAAKILGAID